MEDLWYEFGEVTQSMSDGLVGGSTYALIGIGFTLIFGAMGKLNMAYAGAALGGAYAGLAGFVLIKAPLVLVFGISAAAAAVLGYAIYFACFRFIPFNNHLAALMASVGGLFFIDEVVVHVTRGSPLTFPSMFGDVFFELGPYGIRGDLVFVFIIGLISTGVLLYILFKTRLGLATRAVAQQDIAARLCGIGVHTTNSVTLSLIHI